MTAATTHREATAVTADVVARADPGPTVGRRRSPVRAGQVVGTQAAVALPVAAWAHGPLAAVGAALIAAAVLAVVWVRVRRRWLYQWIGLAVRYRARSRTLPGTAHAADLLRFVAPDASIDAEGVVADRRGLTALVELDDLGVVRAESAPRLPSPAALLPPDDPDLPPARIQLLVSASPAPAARLGGAPPAISYRQLTEGRVPASERAVLAVTVLRCEGWSEPDLRRALTSLARRAGRRVAPLRARPLAGDAALRVLVELAGQRGDHPAREGWAGVHLGGLLHAAYRLRRWPDLRAETARRLVPRLLSLPTTAATVAVGAGPRSGSAVAADLTVRLTAGSPAHLSAAGQAMRRLLSAEGATAARLDGEQLPGLAATLPFGAGGRRVPGRRGEPPIPAASIDALDLPYGVAGLVVGTNRHGAPVVVHLFRPDRTNAVLIGGIRAAQLLAFRAMALGARVAVQTTRPRAWEPFVRGASAPGEAVTLLPPGRPPDGPPPDPLQPLLLVVDIGPVPSDRTPGPAWQALLVVRDDLSAADVDAVGYADLVVLQPLRTDEAALAADALGLGEAADWLTRIRDDMVGVVSRRTVRWALLSPTAIESHLIGPPAR
jgi:type VII secretion protein EccE